jgi:hypothetical protein
MGLPAGQAGTAADTDGQDAGDRGLTLTAIGPDGPGADPECRGVSESVSALVAGALKALDRGDVAAARALLRDVAARFEQGLALRPLSFQR